MYWFWWRNENRKVICAAFPLALRAWDSGTPIRPQRALNPTTLQTPPKQLLPKTTTQESYLKAMILMDLKGLGLCPLV